MRFIQVLVSFSISGWWILNSSSIFRCISINATFLWKRQSRRILVFFSAKMASLLSWGCWYRTSCVCYGMAKLLVPQVLSPLSTIKNWKFSRLSGDASKQNGYGLRRAVPPKKHFFVGLWPFIVIASPIGRIIAPKTPMYKSIYRDSDIPPHL